MAEQLIRSAGSIAANIKEGYGRGLGRQFAQFLGYSLGSTRESRGWYDRGRRLLDLETIRHRYRILTQIIRLLTVAVRQQRNP
ncbi:MAG: four helix bundle protein [Anaerolineae bacterium]